jgi:hypothetical protein
MGTLKMYSVTTGVTMSYAILRTKKLKAITGVLGSGRHTFREMPTPNSNGVPNKHISGARSSAELASAVLAKLPDKRRSNAVLCIEYLITTSPEAFKRHGGKLKDTGKYFDRSIAWLKARHGAENILCATIHLDERTPHLIAYVVPLTRDGRLSARDFLGGPAKLRKMQTSFHHLCGKPFGLSRGIEGAKAPHQKIAQYYQALATPEQVITRTDLAAAAIGIHTQSYTAILERAKASSIQVKLHDAAKTALHDRQVALERQKSKLEQYQRELESREIALEKQVDQLAKVDRALGLALLTADREKERADKSATKLSFLLRRLSDDNMSLLQH